MSLTLETEKTIMLEEGEPEALAQRVLEAFLDFIKCPYEAHADLLITDNDSMREINRDTRGIDSPTDVLSFPVYDYEIPGDFSHVEEIPDTWDPETGELLLGDIVINSDRVTSQAEEYGHSMVREFAFLIVHSLLHLTGYDHMVPEDALIMEDKQRQVMDILGISR